METAQAAPTAPAAPAASSSEMTPAAAAATPPAINVSHNGTPNTAPQPTSSESIKWTNGFDPDTLDFVTQKGFQDAKSVVDSYRNLEKLRGVPQERLLKMPDSGDDKGWNEVYTKLGKPATPEGYGLQPTNPEAPEFTNWAKDTFHKLNLTESQGKELSKQFDTFMQAQETLAAERHTQTIQEQATNLKREWGRAYDQNVGRAQAAYREFGIPDQAVDALERSIGFDGVMKLFHALGSRMGEHTFVGGNGGQSFGDGSMLTPDQANARIRALKQDGDWVKRYLNKDVKAVDEMKRLMEMANPV